MTQTEYHALLERIRHSRLLARTTQVAHCKRDIFYQPLTGRIVDGSHIKVTINLIRIDVTGIDFGYIVAAGLWNKINRKDRSRQFGHKTFRESLAAGIVSRCWGSAG